LSAEVLIESPSALPFASNAKLLAFTVVGFSDFENVSTTCPFGPIPVAPFCGVTAITAGAVESLPVPVVNALAKELLAFPDKSTKPEFACTFTVAFAGSGDDGTNVTTVPVPSRI
jgi:hypothetical protein